ncbi:hypothetical protein EON65_01370 [archaeon]|nr:MAG: hypothetical protein EON65_01370 [archaeon]
MAPQAEEEIPLNPDLSIPKRDMFGRAASRRQRKRSATDGSGSQGAEDQAGDMESGGTMSRTNSSSEVESLSSEDSDVEVVSHTSYPIYSQIHHNLSIMEFVCIDQCSSLLRAPRVGPTIHPV